MKKELKYIIRPNSQNPTHYRLKGPNNEKYNFYQRDFSKWGLAIKSTLGYLEISQSEKPLTKFNLNFLSTSNIQNLKFELKGISKVFIIGDYLEGKGNINWCWRYSDMNSESIILINNLTGEQLAKMEGFSLEAKNRGQIRIDSSIKADYIAAIIASACLIWMLKEDDIPYYMSRKAEIKKKSSIAFKRYFSFLKQANCKLFSV